MPNIQAISKQHHAGKRWKRFSNFSFAATDALYVLIVQELPRAIMSLPVGFTPFEQGYSPVAILGLEPGANLLVGPDKQWRGRYIPEAYRCHPFVLADGGDDKRVLCIDEDSTFAADDDEGEAFFGDDGEVIQTITDILNFLDRNAGNKIQTKIICESLQRHELIEARPITVQIDGKNREVNGIFRVNETALNALSRTALKELRDNRALVVVYCQLLSMAHLQNLVQLAQSTSQKNSKELDFDAFDDSGSLNFDNL